MAAAQLEVSKSMAGSFKILCLALCFQAWCGILAASLVIESPALDGPRAFQHMSAGFGPIAHEYSVSGELVLAEPCVSFRSNASSAIYLLPYSSGCAYWSQGELHFTLRKQNHKHIEEFFSIAQLKMRSLVERLAFC